MIKTQVLKHLLGARAREEGAKEMSVEEQWRRVGKSGQLRARSEKMTQSNTSVMRRSAVPFKSQRV